MFATTKPSHGSGMQRGGTGEFQPLTPTAQGRNVQAAGRDTFPPWTWSGYHLPCSETFPPLPACHPKEKQNMAALF